MDLQTVVFFFNGLVTGKLYHRLLQEYEFVPLNEMTDDFRMPSTLATLFDSLSLTLEHSLLREHETKRLPVHARAAHVLQILVTAAPELI